MDATLAPEYAARVRRGAALLDDRLRSDRWRSRIDLDLLDQRHPWTCVVGQTFSEPESEPEDYLRGLAFLFDVRFGLDVPNYVTQDHGFEEPDDGSYELLTSAWRVYLTQARPIYDGRNTR